MSYFFFLSFLFLLHFSNNLISCGAVNPKWEWEVIPPLQELACSHRVKKAPSAELISERALLAKLISKITPE